MGTQEQVAFALETPDPETFVIRMRGALDRLAGARLLRLVDARLHLVDQRLAATRHLLIDFAGVTAVDADLRAALRHARHACDRRSVALALVRTDAAARAMPTRVRAELARYQRYPSVEIATAAWSARSARRSAPHDLPEATSG